MTGVYGQMRVLLADRATAAVSRAARVARLAVRVVTRPGLGPADVYAALATARFMAAHELVERAADAVEASGDPEIEITDLRTPIWFGGITIHEENER
ncbi:hypothetical protein [Streptomyces laurentii]|uniref:hypothetical protein n=1 Tax=Streptomyces laurentii TaxID=39478 RepID=UPI00367CC66D